MAKITSAIKFTGKLGNVVGRSGLDGKVIIVEKSAKVQNPSTKKQQEQRMKIGFLSKLGAAIPSEAILSLGYNDAKRRAEFAKANYPQVVNTLNQSTGETMATLRRSALILSRGTAQRAPIRITKSYADGVVTISAAMEPGHTPDEITDKGMYMLVYVASTDNSTPPRAFYVDIPNPTTETPAPSITLPIGETQETTQIVFYDVTYELTSEGVATRTSILGENSTNGYNVKLTSALNSVIARYSPTHFAGVTGVSA